MKLSGIIILSALSMVILLGGMSATAYALSCGKDEVIIKGECVNAFDDEDVKDDLGLTTDLELYGQGSTIMISGSINNFESLLPGDVTIVVYSPVGNRVQIAQVTPASDGSFSTTMRADGSQWMTAGDYTVSAHYGSLESSLLIEFTGGKKVVVPDCTSDQILENGKCVAKPPPPPKCTSDQTLVNGECVDKVVPECTSDQTLVDGRCVDKIPPPPPECTSDQELVNGECVDKVVTPPPADTECGEGTKLVDGKCVPDNGGGTCLIATAAYGNELAPQVQLLREIRDNTLFSTASGTSFMLGFNTLYYSFAPTVADWERENPMFKEAVKTLITPMISTLSIMSLADEGSEAEVLGFGISVIALNLGMYIAAPALIGFKIHQRIKSRK